MQSKIEKGDPKSQSRNPKAESQEEVSKFRGWNQMENQNFRSQNSKGTKKGKPKVKGQNQSRETKFEG